MKGVFDYEYILTLLTYLFVMRSIFRKVAHLLLTRKEFPYRFDMQCLKFRHPELQKIHPVGIIKRPRAFSSGRFLALQILFFQPFFQLRVP